MERKKEKEEFFFLFEFALYWNKNLVQGTGQSIEFEENKVQESLGFFSPYLSPCSIQWSLFYPKIQGLPKTKQSLKGKWAMEIWATHPHPTPARIS